MPGPAIAWAARGGLAEALAIRVGKLPGGQVAQPAVFPPGHRNSNFGAGVAPPFVAARLASLILPLAEAKDPDRPGRNHQQEDRAEKPILHRLARPAAHERERPDPPRAAHGQPHQRPVWTGHPPPIMLSTASRKNKRRIAPTICNA